MLDDDMCSRPKARCSLEHGAHGNGAAATLACHPASEPGTLQQEDGVSALVAQGCTLASSCCK
jgi:hypothetical protein